MSFTMRKKQGDNHAATVAALGPFCHYPRKELLRGA